MTTGTNQDSQSSNVAIQLKVLVQIQDLDLQADQLRGKKTLLPTQMEESNATLRKAELAVKQKAAEVAEKLKVIAQTDAAIEMNRERAQRASSKLEHVGNTKEFQAATKETEQLKRLNEELATQREKLLKEHAALQEALQGAEKVVSGLQAEIAAKATEFQAFAVQLDDEIRALAEKRNVLEAQGLPLSVLGRYDRLRAARGGRGLALAQGGRCSGCNMALPPQLNNIVQKGIELCSCPSCSRILAV